jgi:hypothetical protein
MSEDKKPKIDLKSRLQKMGGPAGAPAAVPVPGVPPAAGSVPAPGMMPQAPRSGPGLTPTPPPPSMPPAMGRAPMPAPVPVPAPVAMPHGMPGMPAPQAAPSRPMAVAQPQLIEVDEAAVQQARSGGFKRGLTAGVIVALVLGVLGYFGGNAKSSADARTKGVSDAHDLATDLGKAKDQLTTLAQALDDGKKSLLSDHKFPSDLSQKLAGINVDFAGDKLFGRRFSGVPADTTRQLFDFISRVQTLNDKKDLVISLLNKLQKPITEELGRPAGQFSYVVVVDKEAADKGAFIAPLVTPIPPGPLPADFTFSQAGSGNAKMPRLSGGTIPGGGAAIAVVPSSFDKVCPSATRGQIAQLGSSMNSITQEIQGQKAAEGGDAVTESKSGLADIATQLADALNKVN